jgi:2,5-diamino-6-(ribosylamino)-4(3H)-pyrimidinone 5'-phosphate reductase
MAMERPFTFINSAMSADGKISSIQRRQISVSGREDLSRVAELRASSDAIMVGVGTILADDPGLGVKSTDLRRARIRAGKAENPIRVVADSLARTPPDAKVLGAGCILAVSRAAPEDRLEQLEGMADLVVFGDSRVDLGALMANLRSRGVRRLMVEGGATLNWSLIEAGLVDEIYIYTGPIIIGGESAPTLVDGLGFAFNFPELDLVALERLGDGALLKWRMKRP